MAHYLLNVNNDKPNSPLVPKSLALKLKSPMKLQKLLRKPSKARRRALGKMLEKALAENLRTKPEPVDSWSTKTEPEEEESGEEKAPLRVDVRLAASVDAAEARRIERTLLLSPLPRRSSRQSPPNGLRQRSFSISDLPLASSPPLPTVPQPVCV